MKLTDVQIEMLISSLDDRVHTILHKTVEEAETMLSAAQDARAYEELARGVEAADKNRQLTAALRVELETRRNGLNGT